MVDKKVKLLSVSLDGVHWNIGPYYNSSKDPYGVEVILTREPHKHLHFFGMDWFNLYTFTQYLVQYGESLHVQDDTLPTLPPMFYDVYHSTYDGNYETALRITQDHSHLIINVKKRYLTSATISIEHTARVRHDSLEMRELLTWAYGVHEKAYVQMMEGSTWVE